MNKQGQFISIILILLFGVTIASANTLFSKTEWKVLENWSNDKAKSNIDKAEGYSEPERINKVEFNMSNTFFSTGEWETLKNWNNDKSKSNIVAAEGYSEPEQVKKVDFKMSNTFFSKSEWKKLQNWNK